MERLQKVSVEQTREKAVGLTRGIHQEFRILVELALVAEIRAGTRSYYVVMLFFCSGAARSVVLSLERKRRMVLL